MWRCSILCDHCCGGIGSWTGSAARRLGVPGEKTANRRRSKGRSSGWWQRDGAQKQKQSSKVSCPFEHPREHQSARAHQSFLKRIMSREHYHSGALGLIASLCCDQQCLHCMRWVSRLGDDGRREHGHGEEHAVPRHNGRQDVGHCCRSSRGRGEETSARGWVGVGRRCCGSRKGFVDGV